MSEREESRPRGSAGDVEAAARALAGEAGEERPVTYCVIPPELADRLHEPLRKHFREDSSVEVIVESRRRERRSGIEQRVADEGPPGAERRMVRAAAGRRVGERRAAVAEVPCPELPRRLRRYAEDIRFVRRAEPSTEEAEDRDTARLIARYQAGDREVFSTLYSRYFERVYGYVRLVLSDHHEAEDITQQVFMQLLEALPTYERRRQPFRAWLFIAVRNAAISHLRKMGRIVLEDPQDVANHLDQAVEDEDYEELSALGWIADRDLLLFVERLPLPQRQVLTLRFVLDLPFAEVARMLNRTPDDVRKLQHRALNFLRDRLTAIGRAPTEGNRPMGWERRTTQVKVLRDRRFALMK